MFSVVFVGSTSLSGNWGVPSSSACVLDLWVPCTLKSDWAVWEKSRAKVDDRPKEGEKQKLSALPCIYRCVHRVKDVCGRGGGDDDDGEEARNRALPSQNARPGSDSFSTHDRQLNQQEEKKVHKEAELKRPPKHPTNTRHEIRSDSPWTAQLVVWRIKEKRVKSSFSACKNGLEEGSSLRLRRIAASVWRRVYNSLEL